MAANLKVKAKRTAERRAFAEKIGAEFIAGLDEMLTTTKSGGIKGLKAKHASRVAATLPYTLPDIAAADVTAARTALGLDPEVFALILGVPVQTVRHWESGAKLPTGSARRLIAEIRDTPEYWRKRFHLGSAAAG